jgi:hypothetical protein
LSANGKTVPVVFSGDDGFTVRKPILSGVG